MALIKCSECGKEISDMAQSCPNCGAPVKKEAEKTSKFCMKCGNTMAINERFCNKCDNDSLGIVNNNIQPQTNTNYNASAGFGTICIIGGILAVLGCFLPFVSAFGTSATFFETSNMAFVVLGASLIGSALSIPKAGNKYIIPFLAGIVDIIMAVIRIAQIKDNAGVMKGAVKTEIGFYLVLGGAIAMIIGSAIANSMVKKR